MLEDTGFFWVIQARSSCVSVIDVGIVYSVVVDDDNDDVVVVVLMVEEVEGKILNAFVDDCMNVASDNDALLHNLKAKEEAC